MILKMLTTDVSFKIRFMRDYNNLIALTHTNSGETLYKQQCVVHKLLQPVRTSIVKAQLERARKKYTLKISNGSQQKRKCKTQSDSERIPLLLKQIFDLGIEMEALASERRIGKQGKTRSFLSAQTN